MHSDKAIIMLYLRFWSCKFVGYLDAVIFAISRDMFGGTVSRLTALPGAFYEKLLQGFAHEFTLRETQPPLPHRQY